ncbi:cytochrome c biogenesis protein DipZ [Nakamurella lactea]|uniref:cytochrome c biogenesis protein DipZ n=1 Tax=Nakamurella lactea TaxID=459515 RepID=UPI000418A891|nr:cytochrome c biogenesis protein DipZ [Nakamurella lactea]
MVLTLIGIGLLGGLITGVSPCVLPVLPVVFFAGGTGARSTDAPATAADGTPRRSRRPAGIIAGLVLSFSVVTLVGSLLLSALGLPQDILRWAGLLVLTVIGLSLLVPKLEAVIQRPFYRLPKIGRGVDGNGFVLGLGLGTLYVPCAGPVLAAITIAGASGHVGAGVVVLTVAFAVGVAVPLFFFAMGGDRIGARIAGYRTRSRRFRVAGGGVMIALALALAFNLTDGLQRVVPNYTENLQSAVEDNSAARDALSGLSGADNTPLVDCPDGQSTLAICGAAPAITGVTRWFNTAGDRPLTPESLRGKVVLIDFWTYSCINCQRALPHVESWDAAYRSAGLQVIGVHTPEFAFEKEPGNVQRGIADLGVSYPVAMDNAAATWNAFSNRYWPAEYLIDAAGTVRHVAFGEGGYATTERLIRQLLQAAHPGLALPAPVENAAAGDLAQEQAIFYPTTPETYLASARSENYRGTTPLTPGKRTFTFPKGQDEDTYSLTGSWTVGSQQITAGKSAGIRINYVGQHIYAVLGGSGNAQVIRNGSAVGSIDISGEPRLYPLFESSGTERATLTLRPSAGVQAYTFTFG